MSELPRISVIIPHRETESIETTLAELLKQDYPKDRIEIFSVTGNQPSTQRNACIRESTGDIIYFIDNDSIVMPDTLKNAVELFVVNEQVAIVGGPNISPEDDTDLQKDFSYCLSSSFGVGPVGSRYSRKGGIRETDDRELILCNLFVRRSIFDETEAFREDLYPNEENELMDRVRKQGYSIFYHPAVVVERSTRKTWGAFLRMLLNYGRGRLEQMAHSFRLPNLMFTIPSLFVLYLVSVLVISPLWPLPALWRAVYALPLAFYFVCVGGFGVFSLLRIKTSKWRAVLVIPFITMAIHTFYGLGMMWGLWMKVFPGKPKDVRFEVTKAKSFS